MYRLDQGQSYLPEKQTSLEDRYYNNQSFQEEYSINDPEVNNAATKIQAKFRGHKARQNVEKMKQETKPTIDTDQQELGYNYDQSVTPNQDEDQDRKTPSRPSSSRQQEKPEEEEELKKIEIETDQIFPEEITEEEKEEQERAARTIQARFRGQKNRIPKESPSTPDQQSGPPTNRESDTEKTRTPSSTHRSERIDSDRQDLGGNLTANDQIEPGENEDSDRPRLEREPTQLSEDFERHTQVPRDLDFEQEPRQDNNNEEDDMNDPSYEKAATRIQASYRGYKIRKELSLTGSHDQQQHPISTSPPAHQEYDNTHTKILSPSIEGDKEVEGEEDDTAAAIKIQAAYRGYKVRKELEK